MTKALVSSVAALVLTAVGPAASSTAGAHQPDAGRRAPITAPGSWTGFAFDACSAPASKEMDAWWRFSPFAGVGICIGGVQRRCAQRAGSTAG